MIASRIVSICYKHDFGRAGSVVAMIRLAGRRATNSNTVEEPYFLPLPSAGIFAGAAKRDLQASLQLRVLCLGFFQDGNIGVGAVPEREEIFIRGKGPDAGSIGIRSLRGSRLQSVRPRHSQMRQRPVQQFQTIPLWSRIF